MREAIKLVPFCLLILILYSCGAKSYRVPTPSMEATIMTGEIVFATPVEQYKRNDIVIFRKFENNRWQPFVKRLCGMPGDVVALKNDMLYVNAKPEEDIKTLQYAYTFVTKSRTALKLAGTIDYHELGMNTEGNRYMAFLTKAKADEIRHISGIEHLEPLHDTAANLYILGSTQKNHWNLQNWGPAEVPGKGKSISITPENFSIYKNILQEYEHAAIDSSGKQNYTFKKDYVFLLGDNRENALDSRMFGFLPMESLRGVIMGK